MLSHEKIEQNTYQNVRGVFTFVRFCISFLPLTYLNLTLMQKPVSALQIHIQIDGFFLSFKDHNKFVY